MISLGDKFQFEQDIFTVKEYKCGYILVNVLKEVFESGTTLEELENKVGYYMESFKVGKPCRWIYKKV